MESAKEIIDQQIDGQGTADENAIAATQELFDQFILETDLIPDQDQSVVYRGTKIWRGQNPS